MPYPFPIAPQAYNWWEGNKFRMPPLGQYARPQYAEALAPLAASDPALAAAVPQATAPGILGARGMEQGLGVGESMQPGSGKGVGMNAVTDNPWDLLGGPLTALAGLTIQPAVNALAGMPDKQITSLSPSATLGSIAEAFGWGGSTPVGSYSPMAPEYAYADPDLSSLSGTGGLAQADPYGGGYSGYGSYETPDFGGYGSDISQSNDTTDANYARGGMVRGLIGPNPPGPDDGMAMLDRGEFVVRKKQAAKHRGLLEAINKGKVSKRKARSLLD